MSLIHMRNFRAFSGRMRQHLRPLVLLVKIKAKALAFALSLRMAVHPAGILARRKPEVVTLKLGRSSNR